MPLVGGGGLPNPGGGRIPMITSPEQEAKRDKLKKISFSGGGGGSLGGGGGLGSMSAKPSQKKTGLVFPNFQPHLGPGGVGSSSHVMSDIEKRERGKFLIMKAAHSTGKLKFDGVETDFVAEDLTDLGEIGRGNFGTVNKMTFSKAGASSSSSGKVMAVKRIRSTVDEKEQKQLLMDLEVVMKSSDCPFIVTFYGAIFQEGDCWICMELMHSSLDKFYKFVYGRLRESIPESVIGKITLATVKALNYLKEQLKIIHRDVKPSNILIDRKGAIKLCDFGISGQLVDSIAKTRDAGCRPYMAPERINPQQAKGGYDVRSDVWSLGITLFELATGRFPYPKWNSVFDQLQQVVDSDPPRLSVTVSGREEPFSLDFVNFVNMCLIKDEQQRPKYKSLLTTPFIKTSETETVDVATYVESVLDRYDKSDDVEMADQ